MLASALVVAKGGGTEDAAEFEELLHALNQHLAPVGRLEEMMVEKIAVCSWRQKRALRFEALLIRRASGEHSLEFYEALEFTLTLFRDRIRSEQRWALVQEIFQREGISQPETASELEAVPQPQTAPPLEEDIAVDPRDLLIEELLPNDFAADSQLNEAIYHFGLPADADLDRILRYETSIQRQSGSRHQSAGALAASSQRGARASTDERPTMERSINEGFSSAVTTEKLNPCERHGPFHGSGGEADVTKPMQGLDSGAFEIALAVPERCVPRGLRGAARRGDLGGPYVPEEIDAGHQDAEA